MKQLPPQILALNHIIMKVNIKEHIHMCEKNASDHTSKTNQTRINILIDDDPLVRTIWKSSANNNDINLQTYSPFG